MSSINEVTNSNLKLKELKKLPLKKCCPAPPCTPSGTPTSNNSSTNYSSFSIDKIKISRSNSASLSSDEILSPILKPKILNKRCSTHLLQTNGLNQNLSINNLENTHRQHRLQSLRTIAEGAQKTNSLINQKILNEERTEKEDISKNSEIEKLNDIKNKDDKKEGLFFYQSFKNEEEEANLEDILKDEKNFNNTDQVVQKIIENAKIRKDKLLLLLEEHAQIVEKIKIAENNK